MDEWGYKVTAGLWLKKSEACYWLATRVSVKNADPDVDKGMSIFIVVIATITEDSVLIPEQIMCSQQIQFEDFLFLSFLLEGFMEYPFATRLHWYWNTMKDEEKSWAIKQKPCSLIQTPGTGFIYSSLVTAFWEF